MLTYLLALLSVVGLCVFWAVFQLWLSKHDPGVEKRSLKCGACACEDDCEDTANRRVRREPTAT